VNVGNLLPIKRVDLLVDAFADVRKVHDVRLLIVGEGPERSTVEEKIRRLGLEACVETTGWRDDVRQFAARAWALVHSSDGEGFAQVLTEAMSAGCPVITTDSVGGGPRFVTENGEFGILVPRGDRARLADAMVQMLQPDVRQRYSELGRQRAEALSPAASANALLDFITGQLGAKA
jgi:glycosyltransferase involved in cell wall biosynthesis